MSVADFAFGKGLAIFLKIEARQLSKFVISENPRRLQKVDLSQGARPTVPRYSCEALDNIPQACDSSPFAA